MKKLFTTLAAAALALTVCACSQSQAQGETPVQEPAAHSNLIGTFPGEENMNYHKGSNCKR